VRGIQDCRFKIQEGRSKYGARGGGFKIQDWRGKLAATFAVRREAFNSLEPAPYSEQSCGNRPRDAI